MMNVLYNLIIEFATLLSSILLILVLILFFLSFCVGRFRFDIITWGLRGDGADEVSKEYNISKRSLIFFRNYCLFFKCWAFLVCLSWLPIMITVAIGG